jgi:hypothetical protein
MFSMFTGFFSGRAKAQSFQSATDAPAAWNEFASSLRSKFEAVLRSDHDVARRFQADLEKLKAAGGDKPAPGLTVRVWIAASGQVERVAFASLSDAAANVDLRTLLMRVSAGTPPSGMLQPVRLKLSLEPRN